MAGVRNHNPHRDSARSSLRRIRTSLAVLTGAVVLSAASGESPMVISHVFNGYERERQQDSTYRHETYVFAEGGLFNEEQIGGDTVNTIGFEEVARTVAPALKSQNFLPGKDPDDIEQLIMLWYGTTIDTRYDPAIIRFKDTPMNRKTNARILGWERDLNRIAALSWTDIAKNFVTEFKAGRYFVVLKAYDFQVARNEKRLKLLWESRFSIQRQGADFTAELPAMALSAASTFGKETGGIIQRESPEGHVEIGDLVVVDDEAP
jgi:hypothetical protein